MIGRRDGSWTGESGGVDWLVKRRELEGDAGPSLYLGVQLDSREDAQQWLRFDCFGHDPHWHLDPLGRDEIHPLGRHDDPISEVFDLLRRDLSELLERAGAEPAVAKPAAAALDGVEGERFLVEAERAMRHEPAVLEELDIRRLRQRRSEKWHTYPDDVLPAWVAEMDFPIAAPIQAELRRFVELADVGYPIAPKETGLPEVFSARMSERFDWTPDPARVEILSEVVQGMYLSLEAYAEVGEGAVVQTPIYPPFLHAVRETGRKLVDNPLVPHGDRLEIDFDGLEESLEATTRVFMLCNPHNPSGRVWARAELERLGELALRHDLIVVSDEIHADLVFDGRRHIPFASLSPELAARTVTLTSPSKAFNIPGLRCAIAHFGTAELQSRFSDAHPRHIRGGIGLLGLYASMAAWRWGQPWLEEVVPYLESNRAFARERLAERIPEIRFFPPEATYLAWMDCRALPIEGSPAGHFLREGRVAISDGRAFGVGWDRFARLNLATSRPILAEVIERMAKALSR
jgi:cystathionine beta-lyase